MVGFDPVVQAPDSDAPSIKLDLTSLGKTKLVHYKPKTGEKEECFASTLWAEQTVVIYIMRRLGCPLCRKSASELLSMQDEFAKVND